MSKIFYAVGATRSNRVGGSLSSLGHTENWFRLLHRMARQGADFRRSSLSFACRSHMAAAAMARCVGRARATLSDSRAAQPETLMDQVDYSLLGMQKSLMFRLVCRAVGVAQS
jgi:hypothetical protein